MENKFTSFGLDDERSTFIDGESRSRRSSILKPPKARAPLQEVNLGGSADDETEDFDTLRKRRVSFAGVNSVKEFCSNAESLQVCHIQSYEETFSTSSDNSHNSTAAKSVQVATPNNAVPVGEDQNFVDDPMDLTDSINDNNRSMRTESVVPPAVQVQPYFAAHSIELDSEKKSKADIDVLVLRKSTAPVFEAQSSKCSISSSNMSISSLASAPIGGVLTTNGNALLNAMRNSEAAAMTANMQSSCSMEITEPLQALQNRISSVSAQPQKDAIPFSSHRQSIKMNSNYSDSGMELTEAVPVRIRPFSINPPIDDNLVETSMEITEVIKKTEMKSFVSHSSFNNKSASMEFTEVLGHKNIQSHVYHINPLNIENSGGMELTEPIALGPVRHWPSQQTLFAQNLSEENPKKPHKDTPFPHIEMKVDDVAKYNEEALTDNKIPHKDTPFPWVEHKVGDANDESVMQTPENQSSCDMEMTGVVSLSKYERLVAEGDDGDDMDFTQLLPTHSVKKFRLSNEPDEEPYRMISPLTSAVASSQKPMNHKEPEVPQKSIPPCPVKDNVVETGLKSDALPEARIGTTENYFEEDDTVACNYFKNVRKVDSPVEVSFLKEFQESPVPARPVNKTLDEYKFTSNCLKPGTADYDHLLLYSPPEFNPKPRASRNEDKKSNDNKLKENDAQPNTPFQQKYEENQPSYLNSQNKRSSHIESSMPRKSNLATKSEEFDQLRNVTSSRSFLGNDSSLPRMRVSFKDLEIKADNVAVNESLLAVGLDHSDILKDGYNDLTCPDQVPSVCVSMTSKLASPSSNSMSIVDRSGVKERATLKTDYVCGELMGNVIQTNLINSPSNIPHSVEKKNVGLDRVPNLDDPDTSVSMPFVFKAMPNKLISDMSKLRQSFPVLSFDESPNVDAQRKSFRLMLSPGKESIKNSHLVPDSFSSGQMELTNVLPMNRKSIHSTNITHPSVNSETVQTDYHNLLASELPKQANALMGLSMDVTLLKEQAFPGQLRKSTLSPGNDSVCMEMDETLFKVQPNCNLDATRMGEQIDMSCEIDETNEIQKDVGAHRKSVNMPDHSPLSITNDETACKTSISNDINDDEKNRKCYGGMELTCSGIETSETLRKISVPPDNASCTEMPTNTLTLNVETDQNISHKQYRISSVHSNRKSLVGSQTCLESFTIDETLQGNEFKKQNSGLSGGIPCNDKRPIECEKFDRVDVNEQQSLLHGDSLYPPSGVSLQKSCIGAEAFDRTKSLKGDLSVFGNSCANMEEDLFLNEASNKQMNCFQPTSQIKNKEDGNTLARWNTSKAETYEVTSSAIKVDTAKKYLLNNYDGKPQSSLSLGDEVLTRKSLGGVPLESCNDIQELNMGSEEGITSLHDGAEVLKMVSASRKSVGYSGVPNEYGDVNFIPSEGRSNRKSYFGDDIKNVLADECKLEVIPKQGSLVASASQKQIECDFATSNEDVGLVSKVRLSSRKSCIGASLEPYNDTTEERILDTEKFNIESKHEDDGDFKIAFGSKNVGHLNTPHDVNKIDSIPSGGRSSRKSVFGGLDYKELPFEPPSSFPVASPSNKSEGHFTTSNNQYIDCPISCGNLSSKKSHDDVPQELCNDINEDTNQCVKIPVVTSEHDDPEAEFINSRERSSRKSHFGMDNDVQNIPCGDCESPVVTNVAALIKARSNEENVVSSILSGRSSRKSCIGIQLDLYTNDCNEDMEALDILNKQEGPDELKATATPSKVGRDENLLASCSDGNCEDFLSSQARSNRKSYVGVPEPRKNVVAELPQLASSSSEEFEFAIRRNKRKSTVGFRPDSSKEAAQPPTPATLLDNDPLQEDKSNAPNSSYTEEAQVDRDADLSQDMMNISLNDGDVNDFEDDKMHCTSTPCKSQPSNRADTDKPAGDRKRSFRSNVPKATEPLCDFAHDLSQEMMNISIQSDTRSPLHKKISTGASSHAPTSLKTSSNEKLNDIHRISSRRDQSLYDMQNNVRSVEVPIKSYENVNTRSGDLPYEVRVKNRDLMSSYGFRLLGSQTVWETKLLDNVMGMKLVLPMCEFSELTKIVSVQYTYYPKRIGFTCLLHKDVIEFFKNRMTRNLPEEWLNETCNTIKDLDRILPSVEREIATLMPVVDQLNHLALRYPCQISSSNVSFGIFNLDLMVKFDVEVELKSSHVIRDNGVNVKNEIGKINKDLVQMVFQSLPRDVDLYYAFATYLSKNTSKFLVR